MVTPMQPVILMSLNPPEKDYLYLSMISFFFFILLAIPALLFSIKVGTIWLSPTPLVPRYSSSVPSHPHTSPGTSSCSSWRIYSLLHHLAALVPPQDPLICSSSFFHWGTEPCPYLPHTIIPGLSLPTSPWNVAPYLPPPLETLPPACLHPHRPEKPTFMGIRGQHK